MLAKLLPSIAENMMISTTNAMMVQYRPNTSANPVGKRNRLPSASPEVSLSLSISEGLEFFGLLVSLLMSSPCGSNVFGFECGVRNSHRGANNLFLTNLIAFKLTYDRAATEHKHTITNQFVLFGF